MSFFDLLNGFLSVLDVPYYEGMPEFERSPPEAFIAYSVYDVPKLRGCGEEIVTTYYVTVNIYTSGKSRKQSADRIGTALTALLTENGFIRQGGSFGISNDFPRYYHRIIEFNFDYEEGEE